MLHEIKMNTNKSGSELYRSVMIILCLFTTLLMFSEYAFAAPVAGDIVGSTMCVLVNNLSGVTAKTVATIAIFMVGISLFMGKLQWTTAALVAIGIGLIFASAEIIELIAPNAANYTCSLVPPALPAPRETVALIFHTT